MIVLELVSPDRICVLNYALADSLRRVKLCNLFTVISRHDL